MRPAKIFSIGLLLPATLLLHQSLSAGGRHLTPAPAGDQNVSFICSATDANGVPLRELTIGQVSITDGTRPAQMVSVQDASNLPIDLGIVLLASKPKFDQEQAAAVELAQKLMRPGKDKVFVITANGDKSWSTPNIPWMTDPAAVATVVRGLDKTTGLPDPFNYSLATDSVGIKRNSVQTYSAADGFSVFDVIWLMMKNDPRPAQRAVVIFRQPLAHGPGLAATKSDTSSNQAGMMMGGGTGQTEGMSRDGQQVATTSEATHTRVIATAQTMGVSFFTIGLEDTVPQAQTASANIKRDYMAMHDGNTVSARQYDEDMDRQRELQYTTGRSNVERIADETGGRPMWTNKKNYSDAIASIVSELSSRYIVSFAPAGGSDAGSLRLMKVQVSGAGHVSAPRAYVSPGGN
jgi:VWFA-related protein